MPYFVAAVALLFTVAATAYVRTTARSNDRLRLANAVQSVYDTIHDRIALQVSLLRGAAGLFAVKADATRAEFATYVASVRLESHYPGTLGVGFLQRLKARERDALITRMSAGAAAPFRIWPEEPPRDEYYPIVYLEPLDELNQLAIGYDMFTEPVRRAAMEQARDQSRAVASGRVVLVQEQFGGAQQPGFLIYLPVYRGGRAPDTTQLRQEQLLGFIYTPLRAGDLLESVLGGEHAPTVDFEVFDGAGTDPAQLMYRSNDDQEGVIARSGNQPELTHGLDVAGREWTIVFAPNARFVASSSLNLATWVLASGLLVTVVLFFVSHAQARARLAAERSAAELRRSQAAMRENEARKSAILESALDCIISMDHEGRIVDFNPAAERTFGYRRAEVVGRTVAESIIPPHLRAAHARGLKEFKRTGTGPVIGQRIEITAMRADGSEFPVELTVGATRLEGRPVFFTAYVRDITERRGFEGELDRYQNHLEQLVAARTAELDRSNERLRQSERMAAIGTLSAGLGHDMGNLLLPVRLRLDTMEARGLPPQFREDVEAIRKSSEYLQQLTTGLRLLALDPDDASASDQTIDLEEWWKGVMPVFKNALPRRIELHRRFAANLPGVLIARHMLTQVMFNLVQNAGDSMRERPAGNVWITAAAEENGAWVRISVTDDGPGMTPEVRQRCMEPFFTTKTRGISTGLGLALVHGIVTKAGGSIEVESELERGTTFTMRLPSSPISAPRDGRSQQTRQQAVVSLNDTRMGTYVASVLNSLGFDVAFSPQPVGPGARLWVVEPKPQSIEAAQTFVNEDSARFAVIFGSSPYAIDSVRIVQIDDVPRPSTIWRTLRDVARACGRQE